MKKLILFFTMVTVAMMTGCDPEGNSWQWWIKNDTDQTLKLKYFSFAPRTPAYSTAIISPGDSICLYRVAHGKSERLHYDDYFKKCVDSYGEDAYLQILSEDDTVLKTWSYSEKDMPNQRFFDESSWTHAQGPGQGAFVLLAYSWTFEILPEDILPEDQ